MPTELELLNYNYYNYYIVTGIIACINDNMFY